MPFQILTTIPSLATKLPYTSQVWPAIAGIGVGSLIGMEKEKVAQVVNQLPSDVIDNALEVSSKFKGLPAYSGQPGEVVLSESRTSNDFKSIGAELDSAAGGLPVGDPQRQTSEVSQSQVDMFLANVKATLGDAYDDVKNFTFKHKGKLVSGLAVLTGLAILYFTNKDWIDSKLGSLAKSLGSWFGFGGDKDDEDPDSKTKKKIRGDHTSSNETGGENGLDERSARIARGLRFLGYFGKNPEDTVDSLRFARSFFSTSLEDVEEALNDIRRNRAIKAATQK